MVLTDAKIRNTRPSTRPIKLTDGGGLHLDIRPSGARLWRYRYRIGGRENLFAVGRYPEVGLAEARALRAKARALVKQGIHPAHERQAARLLDQVASANTFEVVAREWIARKRAGWTPYYARQVERFLEADVFPHVGALPIRKVTAAHLWAIIKRVEERGAETIAMMVRQWASAIFRYAISTLRADGDPAAALKGAIQRPKPKHAKPLSRDEIAAFMKALDGYGGHRTTVIALRLMLLTFVRTKELRTAPWTEVDFHRAEWRLAAGRMKMREGHIVPLPHQAVTLLRELHTLTGGGPLLFPNSRDATRCMTATTLNRALERLGFNGKNTIGFSAHGFRATASTILNERGFRPELIERQLAHAERNKVRAAYNRAEYFPERRVMMQAWADLIDQLGRAETDIVPIRRPAA